MIRYLPAVLGIVLLALVPVALMRAFASSEYFIHIAVQILLWGFIYTAWSLMGRFGLVSLGHGAFLGIGAYGPALLWNLYGITPWLGIPVSVAAAALLALVIGYPATRAVGGASWYALQFPQKSQFYFLALVVWLGGLAIWLSIDRAMGSRALEAINEDEGAAAAIGINVMREKLRVTLLSAALTAFGGGIFVQYLMYVNPETVSGVGVSLQIVFAAIAGGMYTLLGPTTGALFTIALNEALRVVFGTAFIGAANTIYGVLLVLFIIFMPRGILGLVLDAWMRRSPASGNSLRG